MRHNIKYLLFPAAAACVCSLFAGKPATTATWQTLGNDSTTYLQRITVKGDLDFDRLAYNAFARTLTPVDSCDKVIELVPGYYAIESPKFHAGADSAVIDIVTGGQFYHISYAPDGMHTVKNGADGSFATAPVDLTLCSVAEFPRQWQRTGRKDMMPYGDQVFDRNVELTANAVEAGPFDIIPSYKQVDVKKGWSKLPLKVKFKKATFANPEEYTINIKKGVMTISAADSVQYRRALNIFNAMVLPRHEAAGRIPDVEIHDCPDMPYRAIMIDVSRNFQTPEAMKRILDLMALYRFNTLHFHFADDEAWRLEMPSLPELTTYGGRRGYTTDESEYLAQIFSGNGDPDTGVMPSNGYFTRAEFIDMLRHAASLGIQVLPEVESPGHARAAIKAMEKRYRASGDDSLRLIHDGDTSKYTSAQSFHDNVVNPALESTYRFFDLVFTDIQDMYREAGVELPAIHIGGDEVARGAWNGSQVALDFIEAHKLNGEKGLHGYFVERIGKMLEDKGIKMSGWQEIGTGHTDEYNTVTRPRVYSVNSWTVYNPKNDNGFTEQALRAGYPVVLSNVNHYYLDMCYSEHTEEPGLNWGGTVDEFVSLNGYPNQLHKKHEGDTGRVIGVSGHLFAETLRSPEQLQMYLLPKMLGLAERAWNNEATYTDSQFNTLIGSQQIPMWERLNYNYHMRQPGIKVVDGSIVMNSPYPEAVIRYTLDGSEPTENSPVYNAPISANGNKQVRAKLYHNGKASVQSILYLE